MKISLASLLAAEALWLALIILMRRHSQTDFTFMHKDRTEKTRTAIKDTALILPCADHFRSPAGQKRGFIYKEKPCKVLACRAISLFGNSGNEINT